ncbi:MAG: hypothetical protein U0353_13280 [Sandaracinus sp.]
MPRFVLLDHLAPTIAGVYLRSTRTASDAALEETGATLVEKLQVEITSIQTSLGRRAATLLCDTIALANQRRALAMMLTLRGFVELVAALVHFETRTTAKLAKGISTQAEMDELMAHLRRAGRGSRFDWQRWWMEGEDRKSLVEQYGKLKKPIDAPKPEVEQINVMTMIDHLDSEVSSLDPAAKGRVYLLYSMLSDMCHPAQGGDLLFADPSGPVGYVSHSATVDEGVFAHQLASIALPALCDCAQIAARALNRLSNVVSSLRQV